MTATTNGTNGVHADGGAPLQRAEELNTVSAESCHPQTETSRRAKQKTSDTNSETGLS